MSAADRLAAQLGALVQEWLPSQRWFAGKGRTFEVTVHEHAQLPAPEFYRHSVWLADVRYADGTSELYQLPLVLRRDPDEQLEYALLGTVDLRQDGDTGDGGGQVFVYDALHDRDVTGTWLAGIAAGARYGSLSCHLVAEPEAVPQSAQSIVHTGEQSNTSLIYGDDAILKVFRRLEPGRNPDIEVHEALGRLGGRNVARLLGYVETEVAGASAPMSLAMLQEFMTTATDGWTLAKISVRDLMAEADLHADEAGGDFAGEAHRLGVATAQVHADLAAAFGQAHLSPDDLTVRVEAMRSRLDAAIEVVPALADLRAALRSILDEVLSIDYEVTVQRIHGDLHLGQVLRTVHRWVVLDFEGEPAKAMTERTSNYSPLRDIAGMLRSFDYAARNQLIDMGSTPQTEYRAAEWAARNRAAFLAGYAEASGADPSVHDVLLRALETDKAVYEAVYEARNRPSWLAVPVSSLTRIAAETEVEG